MRRSADEQERALEALAVWGDGEGESTSAPPEETELVWMAAWWACLEAHGADAPPIREEHQDNAFPVGADQGAPRLDPKEWNRRYMRSIKNAG